MGANQVAVAVFEDRQRAVPARLVHDRLRPHPQRLARDLDDDPAGRRRDLDQQGRPVIPSRPTVAPSMALPSSMTVSAEATPRVGK